MNDPRRNSSIRRVVTAGQTRLVLRFALVAVLFGAVGLFHAATHISVVRAGYDLGKVEREHREALREHEHLKMERATLRSAARLESIAKSRLGLQPPAAGQVLSVNANSRVSPEPKRTVAAVERTTDRVTQ